MTPSRMHTKSRPNKQTNKCWWKLNLLGGSNKNCTVLSATWC